MDILNIKNKIIVLILIIAGEIIIGSMTSFNLKFSAALVSFVIFLGIMSVVGYKRAFYLIFLLYPFTYIGVGLGESGLREIRLIHILFSFIVISAVLRIITSRSNDFKLSTTDIPFILFLLWSLLSIFWSSEKPDAILMSLKMSFAIAIYFFTINLLTSQNDLYICLWAFFIALNILVAIGFLQMMGLESLGTVEHSREYVTTYGSFTMRPQEFAYEMVNGFWLSLFLAGKEKHKYKQYLIYACAALMLVHLFFSAHRTSYLAFLVTLSIFLLLRFRVRHFLFYSLSGVLVVLLVLFLAPYSSGKNILFYVASTFNPHDMAMSFRYMVWLVNYEMIRHNFFIGVGIGAYPSQYSEYAPPLIKKINLFTESQPNPHSFFFDIFTELGVIGFLLYSFIVYRILKNLYKAYFQFNNTPDTNLIIFTFLMLINIMVHCITGTYKESYFVWINFGLAMATCSILRKTQNYNTVINTRFNGS